jgi:hypothetical protein
MAQLTVGAIRDIYNGLQATGAILQLIDVKKINNAQPGQANATERYRYVSSASPFDNVNALHLLILLFSIQSNCFRWSSFSTSYASYSIECIGPQWDFDCPLRYSSERSHLQSRPW